MVFAPTNNPNDTSDQTVNNIDFFPDILVADFRKAVRLQDTVTDERVIQSLQTAMMDTNRELVTWRATQETAGNATLAAVPSDDYGPNGTPYTELMHQYLTAVYANAKALLIEFYNDIDTSDEGGDRTTSLDSTKDVYRREAREAIRNMLGKNHATVELI